MAGGMVGNGVRREIKWRSVRHVLNISCIATVLPTVVFLLRYYLEYFLPN